eukprot:GHVS01030804.1.p1 GENE.GHVS01030804.1~~GHVS01030804.1.p1  ORF type:complete len:207 (+),score=32.47 GHVS01030804.1:100-720(+)
MGISRDSRHKHRKTGGRMPVHQKKRKFELGRPPANTRMGPKRVRSVRCRGGNLKYRGLRLDSGNYSWGSENVARKTRILDVVYNASNNELVRTKTLVKNAIVMIDATPFKLWYKQHYGLDLGKKKGAKGVAVAEDAEHKISKRVAGKQAKRAVNQKVDAHLEEQFTSGKVLACIASRPGQCGRVDGYILEGRELEFYKKKVEKKKK